MNYKYLKVMGLLPKNRLFATLKHKGCDMDWAQERLTAIQEGQEESAYSQIGLDTYLNSSYQENQRSNIVDYHYEHTPAYRAICHGIKPIKWEEVPIMDKSDLRSDPLSRLSADYKGNDVFINSTSGSSGHPVQLARDREWHALVWSQVAANYKRAGIEVGVDKEARFYGRATGRMARFKDMIKDKAANRKKFDVYDSSESSLSAIVDEIAKGKFAFLNGYTSAIRQLAIYCQNNKIVLSKHAKSLKAVICTSEMLIDEHAHVIVNSLGAPLYNEYGASECGIISFSQYGKLWTINSALLYVEVVDNDGRVLPEGQVGDILVTCLESKASPLIRYRIGDRGVIKFEKGKPFIDRLEGRSNQFIQFSDGHKVIGLIVLSATKAMMKKNVPILELVAQQTRLDTLEVFYTSERELLDTELRIFENAIRDLSGRAVALEYNRVERIPRSTSGKLLQFTSKL